MVFKQSLKNNQASITSITMYNNTTRYWQSRCGKEESVEKNYLTATWAEVLVNADRFKTFAAGYQLRTVQFVNNTFILCLPLVDGTTCNSYHRYY